MKEKTNQLIESTSRTFNSIQELLKKKNADYAGDADTYKNFLDPELQSYLDKHKCDLDAVQLGIRIRLKDKWSRLNTLLFSDKDPSVKDESLDDTLSDIIGYVAIMKAWREFSLVSNEIIYTSKTKWNDLCECGHQRNSHWQWADSRTNGLDHCLGNGATACPTQCINFMPDLRGNEI